jgi:signal peptidase II
VTIAPKTRWFVGTALTVLVLDIITKAWILDSLRYGERVPVIDGFFDLVSARNTGAAFGFLADAPSSWTIPFFIIITVGAMIFLTHLVRRLPADMALLPLLLGGIAGGAVGNAIDRVRFGHVVDFLLVYVGRWHWPAFNVADMGISVGVTLLLILSFSPRYQSALHPEE